MRKFWFSPNIFANGFLWLVGLAMQIGGWVSHLVAYILLGIALIWSICIFIYWITNKDKIAKKYDEKAYYDVIPLLQKMAERIMKLARQEAMRVIDFDEYKRVNNTISEDIIGVPLPKPTTIKGLKRSTSKLESLVGDKLKEEITSYRSAVEKLESITSFLDAKGFGLKQRKDNDKKYTRLVSQLQRFRNLPLGTQIDDLIDLHMRLSESFATMLLATIRATQVKIKDADIRLTDVISTQMTIGMEQLERDMSEQISRIRARIGECIRKGMVTSGEQR